jgi:tRNA threonylcarbamoyladenosine biosynthesis protein TsaB
LVILGLETATPRVGAAVSRGGVILSEVMFEAKGRQPLLVAVEQALQLAEVPRAEIDGVAYSRGPGSFTGLRVGLATAKGIAYALKKPLVGVGTLAAFAGTLRGPTLVAPLLDAKKGEVYGALYSPETGEARLAPLAAAPPAMAAALFEAAGGAPFVAIGDGAALLSAHLPGVSVFAGLSPRASEVARIGALLIAGGEAEDPSAAAPTYLRLPEAVVKAAAGRPGAARPAGEGESI